MVLRRAQALRECCIIAGDNILIAQHREPYDMPRCGVAVMPPASSTSSPRLLCLRREPSNTALMDARPQIFRIVEVRRNGVLLLEGRCSSTFTAHLTHVAPCHLPDVDPTQDPRLDTPHADIPCAACLSPEKEAEMLMCDSCGLAYHLQCLRPPLQVVPPDLCGLPPGRGHL